MPQTPSPDPAPPMASAKIPSSRTFIHMPSAGEALEKAGEYAASAREGVGKAADAVAGAARSAAASTQKAVGKVLGPTMKAGKEEVGGKK